MNLPSQSRLRIFGRISPSARGLSGEHVQAKLVCALCKIVLYLNLRSLHGGFQASMRRGEREV